MSDSKSATPAFLRRLTRDDVPAAMALKNAAGWNQTEEDWLTFLDLAGEGCVCLEKHGQVVATSTAISYGDRFGWIGMVLVADAERRQGHGTRMLQAALDHLDSQDVVSALDATPAGLPLYRDCGFEELYSIERWIGRVTGTSRRTSDLPCRPWVDGDNDAVLALDRRAFGADRAALLLAFHRRLSPGVDLVGEAGDSAAGHLGYLIVRPGSRFTHIGPVVATSADLALALIDTALSRLEGENVGIDLLSHHSQVVRFVRSRGLRRERSLVRMVRPAGEPGVVGDPPPGGRTELVYAIAGPEWG